MTLGASGKAHRGLVLLVTRIIIKNKGDIADNSNRNNRNNDRDGNDNSNNKLNTSDNCFCTTHRNNATNKPRPRILNPKRRLEGKFKKVPFLCARVRPQESPR